MSNNRAINNIEIRANQVAVFTLRNPRFLAKKIDETKCAETILKQISETGGVPFRLLKELQTSFINLNDFANLNLSALYNLSSTANTEAVKELAKKMMVTVEQFIDRNTTTDERTNLTELPCNIRYCLEALTTFLNINRNYMQSNLDYISIPELPMEFVSDDDDDSSLDFDFESDDESDWITEMVIEQMNYLDGCLSEQRERKELLNSMTETLSLKTIMPFKPTLNY